MLPLLFIDFETTGLDPFVDEIVQAAYIQLTHEDLMKGRFSLEEIQNIYVMPLNPQRAFMKSPGSNVSASDINGFDIKKWEKLDSRRWIDATQSMHSVISTSRWTGMNPCFDYQFYTTLCNRHHIRPSIPGTYHICDVTSMAYHLYINDSIADIRLNTIAEYYNLERKTKTHDAREDVYLTAQIYRRLHF